MKRLIIVMFLLAGTIFLSVFSAYTVDSVKLDMSLQIINIKETYESGDKNDLLKKLDALNNYWASVENKLMNFVHRDLIDAIARDITRLYPLAEQESWAIFHAEISSVLWQINNIQNFENFSYLNVF